MNEGIGSLDSRKGISEIAWMGRLPKHRYLLEMVIGRARLSMVPGRMHGGQKGSGGRRRSGRN